MAKKGPVGKLHNIVTFIRQSNQCNQLFHKFQRVEFIATKDNQQTYDLVTNNDTRQNSTHDMIMRAIKIRNAIDAFIQHIKTKWDSEEKGKNPSPQRKEWPTIIDDELTSDDWTILSEYLDILAPLKEATLRLEG